jgi:hypothetical protein
MVGAGRCDLIRAMPAADAIDFHIEVPQAAAPLIGRAAEIRAQLRAALGLSQGVVTGAGHQPVVWHAGLLAKFIAASADAAALAPGGKNGAWIHFVSDQDLVEPSRIDLPVRDAVGSVRKSSLQCSSAWSRSSNPRASASYPPYPPQTAEAACASDSAAHVLGAFVRQLGAHQQRSSAALQFAEAVRACAEPWIGQPALTIGSATLLSAAAPLIDEILREPERSAIAFNEALRIDPHAARPLRVAGDASELPLWRVGDDGTRARVTAHEARGAMYGRDVLLPRAFIASGLLRLCCDCFYHGTGGARYERVSEVWWRRFFGIELPPFGTATATLLPLPTALGIRAVPALPRISHRRLWWNPHLLTADRAQQDARKAIMKCIEQAPRRSTERAAHYAALHELIAHGRAVASVQLDHALREEGGTRDAHREATLASDRTWPFLLLERDSVDALAARITRAVHQARRDPQMTRCVTPA